MEIKITCDGTEYIDYRQLKPFQGNLKTITEENLQKLKNSIIKYGFTVPAFVWQSGEDKYILDILYSLTSKYKKSKVMI